MLNQDSFSLIHTEPVGNCFLFALIFLLTTINLHGQCAGTTVLTVTNGTTGTWVNTTGSTQIVRITAVGAGGGNGDVLVNNNPGGSGTTIVGEFVILNGQTINAIAGEPGYNSNGAAGGGGGGGSGAVNCGSGDCSTGTVLLIASGGGGGGLGALSSDQGIGGLAAGTSCGDIGNGGTGNSGAGGGGMDTDGEDGVAGAVIAKGGGKVDPSNSSSGGTGAGDIGGVLAGDGGDGMGGGGGGGLSEGGGGAGHSGGNAGGVVIGESGGSGGSSCNTGASQLNISGANGGGANIGSVVVECLGVLLPVELTKFEASPLLEGVKLDWETASELSNLGFFIQHSTEFTTWDDVEFVEGKGTTELLQGYSYVHHGPQNGLNYYRLKQMDFDGTFDYSSIVSIKIGIPYARALFYPNPVCSGNVNIELSGVDEKLAILLIYDGFGLIIYEEVLSIQGGSPSSYSVPTSELPSGIYTVVLEIERTKIIEKIVIAKE